MLFRRKSLFALAVCLGLAGCAGEAIEAIDPNEPLEPGAEKPLTDVEARLQAGHAFVPIARDIDAETLAARKSALPTGEAAKAFKSLDDAPEDFYLAVHKSQLGEHFFLSAILKNYIASDTVAGGYSLGTRVVAFEVQNDRLFVFDVDRRKRISDLFDPDVLLEAYPVVSHRRFRGMRGARNYVLFDPAAGLNRFSMLGDYADSENERISVDISFLKGYRQVADGITYDQVFSGYSNVSQNPDDEYDTPLEPNDFRVAGTMSMSIRRYDESPDFIQTAMPYDEQYFRSDTRVNPETGDLEQSPLHWNVHPGMEPIEWVISHDLVEFNARPEYQDIDLVSALARGIESWNEAFGFEVFTARVAEPGEDIAVDDKNFFLFDSDPLAGSAFAQWRSNPNTGEIRGASAYIPAVFMRRGQFSDDPGAGDSAEPGNGESSGEALAAGDPPPVPAPVESQATPRLAWGPLASQPHCMMPAHAGAAHATSDAQADRASPQDADYPLTEGQKLERYITLVSAHEVGHTLGLRHNFKGSVEFPSTSLMDYLGRDDVVYSYLPGSYDVEAVRYSHGLNPEPSHGDFCTDDDVALDPGCVPFDPAGQSPFFTGIDDWRFIVDYLLNAGVEGNEIYLDYYSRYLRSFVVGNEVFLAAAAYEELFFPIRSPFNDPFMAQNADDITRRLLILMWQEGSVYDRIFGPPTNPMVLEPMTYDLGAIAEDPTQRHDFDTRRMAVDLLKRLQTEQAFMVLLEANNQVSEYMASQPLDDHQLALTEDLLARIEQACDPYFD